MIINYKKDRLPNLQGTKVLVGGCFDILHYGHFDFLKKASDKGKNLIVALESDEFIKRTKKRKPIHSQKQRAFMLQSIKYVKVVILLPLLSGYEDYLELTKFVQPNIIAITKGDTQEKNKKKQAQIVGARVEIVNKVISPFSTSYIIKQCASSSE